MIRRWLRRGGGAAVMLSALLSALVVMGCSPDAGESQPGDPGKDAGGEGEGEGEGDGGAGETDSCAAAWELCDGLDNDCDGLTDEDFLLDRDVLNCGACGKRCRYTNAAAACVEGECEMGRCLPGYIDADERDDTGCEARCTPTNGGIEICDGLDNDCNGVVDDGYDLDFDVNNCGECGAVCVLRHAVATCVQGECAIERCETGWYDEDEEPLTGCEESCRKTNDGVEICDRIDNDCDGLVDEDFDLQRDMDHCGDCNAPCAYDNAVARCLFGDCLLDSCLEGWSNRNGRLDDGCEAPCVESNGGVEICDDEDNDCDGEVDEDFDLQTDVAHCGRCNRECRAANGEAGCVEGDCVIVSCDPGSIDADGRYENGCETPCTPDEDPFELCDGRDNDCDGQVDELYDLDNDPFNCGACDRICAFANAVAGCVSRECVIDSCEAGFANIDRRPDNGCEALCETSNGGVEICDGEDNDCNGVVDDGFELLSDPDNCGACDRVCDPVDHATRGCLAGECGIGECEPGFHDADRRVDTGCEYRCDRTEDPTEICDELDNDCDGQTDEGFDKLRGLDHCGGCFQDCHPADAVPVCDEGVCRIARCEDGFHDANDELGDGCELECDITNDGVELCDEVDNDCNGVVDDGYDKASSPATCGDCATSCFRLAPNRDVACVEGECQIGECLEGWVDENDEAEDGCEYACTVTGDEVCDGRDNDCDRAVDEGFDLQGDIDNCGQCGRECRYEHADAVCDSGVCLLGECDEGWWDVDRNPATGCEHPCTQTADPEEVCDGKDNDCNGVVDDGYDTANDVRNCGECGHVCELPGATPFCNEGRCEVLSCADGRRNVNRAHEDGCECVLTNGGVETCDGRDNDCNGEVDDNLGSPPVTCLGLGVCLGIQPTCLGEQGWACSYPETYQEVEDVCDDLDNDCDGQVDEGFPGLGVPCSFGIGDCQGAGEMVCNLAGDGIECSEEEHPERRTEEVCDGRDNDCDGETDENSDALVAVGDSLLIYAYEAARLDATGQSSGSSFARACSTAGHLPWTNVDWDTARLACSRAGGKYLCSMDEWQLACGGADGWAYPYAESSYEPATCNGYDRGESGPLPAGSLEGCQTPAGVFDQSGNVWEWVDVDRSDGGGEPIRAFAGGSWGNVDLGLRCDFDVAADPTTARESIGFRCCTDVLCQDREEPCAAGQYCKLGVCHDL